MKLNKLMYSERIKLPFGNLGSGGSHMVYENFGRFFADNLKFLKNTEKAYEWAKEDILYMLRKLEEDGLNIFIS